MQPIGGWKVAVCVAHWWLEGGPVVAVCVAHWWLEVWPSGGRVCSPLVAGGVAQWWPGV